MIRIVFPGNELNTLRARLQGDRRESAAIALALPVRTASGWRLIVREVHVPPEVAYEERTPTAARLKPSFGLPIEKRASDNRWSLLYCHTHPNGPAQFSPIDDRAEKALGEYARSRSEDVPHCAMLFAGDTVVAREMGNNNPARVWAVGATVEQYGMEVGPVPGDQFDRQVRAFGLEGQRRINGLAVAIVGLGGTGSIVAQQLAHLGVQTFVLIDHDLVEATNLNRTVGTFPNSVGKPKVEAAKHLIQSINPRAIVDAVLGDVRNAADARRLTDVDFVFCCTDSHSSRHVINQIAYQYAVPVIDMGVSITVLDDQAPQIAGHAKALAPTLACLWCFNSLSPRQVREEMMTPEQRKLDPYFQGAAGVAQPAVISINSLVASSAVTMFLAMVTGIDAPARFVVYDGNRQRLAAAEVNQDERCNFCGPNSTALFGDRAPLPTR